jgi:glycosyltransferase involved in cell wall biosynthesis
MKIIQINASYKPAFVYGGPTMSVSKLSEVLISEGLDLEVLTTQANGICELEVPLNQMLMIDNVPVTYHKRLTKDHTHFSPGLYKSLLNRIKNTPNNSDIVIHIHTWWNLVSMISCFIAIIRKIPVIVSPRGTLSQYSFNNKNNYVKATIFALSKRLLNRCHFHVTSANEKNAILGLLNPKSIYVIPNLVDIPIKLNFLSNQDHAPFKILFLSRIEEKKGLELLFLALEKIPFNYQLNIAGAGAAEYISKLKTLAFKLNIDKNISWLGHQPTSTKFDILNNHHLLVLPSFDENFANVVIESLSMGTPVVITENVGLSDYVAKEDLGWICKIEVKDLRSRILHAFEDSEKRERIRKVAPNLIRKDFSDKRLAMEYLKMYEQILNDRHLKGGS